MEPVLAPRPPAKIGSKTLRIPCGANFGSNLAQIHVNNDLALPNFRTSRIKLELIILLYPFATPTYDNLPRILSSNENNQNISMTFRSAVKFSQYWNTTHPMRLYLPSPIFSSTSPCRCWTCNHHDDWAGETTAISPSQNPAGLRTTAEIGVWKIPGDQVQGFGMLAPATKRPRALNSLPLTCPNGDTSECGIT